ncbi:MAG: galactokinase, partial [Pyrinomonadaceae bacterium]|nr:galactokinase [Sphingobacteriaceae bacterium]
MGNLDSVANLYRQKYNSDLSLFRSPGRVNIIGEHTDYNLGSVLPGAINKYIYLAIGKRDDDNISIDAADYDDHYSVSLLKLEPAWKMWPNYVLGVISEFQKAGKNLSGVNIVFGGDIPLSAGMSSSAAICSATAFALNKTFNTGYSLLELAKIALVAEHKYLGVNLFGKEGNVVKFNCKTEEYQFIPFDAPDIKIVLFDTGVKHNLIT